LPGKPRKSPREKDLTARYLSGGLDEDRIDSQQRFSRRNSEAQQQKMMKTALLRAADEEYTGRIEALPLGQVSQVHSLFIDVTAENQTWLCVVRKMLNQISETAVVVGDQVRFLSIGTVHETGKPEGVIEQVLPRKTLLTRTDSLSSQVQHPIVANAQQMLIVAAIVQPAIKWGLIDRMIVAAQAGGLRPILCINKLDLLETIPGADKEWPEAQEVLSHYRTLGIDILETSVTRDQGITELRERLQDQTTVLAGHSGVGKSSLIGVIQPGLDLRVGAISNYTNKGRHTTTSARIYNLDIGGQVIDTPGVKHFGLWGATPDNLGDFFPDVADGEAPKWRVQSYQRIARSLHQEEEEGGR
jgi:ribosome biogenesis GTPase